MIIYKLYVNYVYSNYDKQLLFLVHFTVISSGRY